VRGFGDDRSACTIPRGSKCSTRAAATPGKSLVYNAPEKMLANPVDNLVRKYPSGKDATRASGTSDFPAPAGEEIFRFPIQ
jgi:hypothetical protein